MQIDLINKHFTIEEQKLFTDSFQKIKKNGFHIAFIDFVNLDEFHWCDCPLDCINSIKGTNECIIRVYANKSLDEFLAGLCFKVAGNIFRKKIIYVPEESIFRSEEIQEYFSEFILQYRKPQDGI